MNIMGPDEIDGALADELVAAARAILGSSVQVAYDEDGDEVGITYRDSGTRRYHAATLDAVRDLVRMYWDMDHEQRQAILYSRWCAEIGVDSDVGEGETASEARVAAGWAAGYVPPEILRDWSESAKRAGDAETHVIVEIARGHADYIREGLDEGRYALAEDAESRVRALLAADDPKAAALAVAATW